MDSPVNIFIIDDSEDDRLLYRRALKAAFGERLQIDEAASGEVAFDAIVTAEPSCVLLDYSLPGRNGLEVLKRIRAARPHLPVVMLTGQGNEAVAVQSMREGAQDYITKNTITPESLGRIVRTAIDTSALQKRVQQQRQTVELFNHALAHDLREPVRTVCSFADIICGSEIGDERRDGYMRLIRDAGHRMAMLIDTVFAYTQLNGEAEPTREVFGLDEAASAAAGNLSALFGERGAEVSIDSLPLVTANRVQVTQVLQNLMLNAVSHSVHAVRISIEASRDGNMVRVVVRDNGPGIALDNQRKIFQPFHRLNRDNHHSGLGLAITQKIVEAHGGRIGCDSIVGEGSSFHFTLPGALPAVEAPSTVAMGAVPAPVETARLANVLVVDDREGDIELARLFLEPPSGMRCNFLTARDGEEGLATILDQQARNDPVDLILLDINMPVMDGFEMLEALGRDATFRRIPVVMCSGSTLEAEKARARALGAVAYLAKTVRFDQLEPVLEAAPGVRLAPDADGVRSLMRAA
jgi:signal transduction histidine kinase